MRLITWIVSSLVRRGRSWTVSFEGRASTWVLGNWRGTWVPRLFLVWVDCCFARLAWYTINGTWSLSLELHCFCLRILLFDPSQIHIETWFYSNIWKTQYNLSNRSTVISTWPCWDNRDSTSSFPSVASLKEQETSPASQKCIAVDKFVDREPQQSWSRETSRRLWSFQNFTTHGVCRVIFTQRHLATENFDNAVKGMKHTRRFKKHTCWFRMLLGSWDSILLLILKVVRVHGKRPQDGKKPPRRLRQHAKRLYAGGGGQRSLADHQALNIYRTIHKTRHLLAIVGVWSSQKVKSWRTRHTISSSRTPKTRISLASGYQLRRFQYKRTRETQTCNCQHHSSRLFTFPSNLWCWKS